MSNNKGKKNKQCVIADVTTRLLPLLIDTYVNLSLIVMTVLLLLIAIFGGEVIIRIDWDSYTDLINHTLNVW